MAEHAHNFFLLTIFGLATVLLVFGMKYFSAARQARLGALGQGAYRELAEKGAVAQSASAASLATLQAELAEVKGRLAAIERILKEVE
jgi:Tfp pilus assembly protein PilO